MKKSKNSYVGHYNQANDIKLLLKIKEIAKKENKIVNSIDELFCENHPNSEFKVNLKDHNFILYQCDECFNDTTIYDKKTAYDCKDCGIVIGKPNLNSKNKSEYYCKICNNLISVIKY
jgi:ribosomal protein S27E